VLVRHGTHRVPVFAVWMLAGLVYAGVLLLGPILLRNDISLGFVAILFLFAIVWITDTAAYFAGRAFGGPKLWPAVSPKKTWSGAIGGTLGGVAAGLLVVKGAGLAIAPMLVLVAVGLSIVSQAGDLLESAVKRHFGAKDASQLIPGHGGLMDRLDGFLTAVAAAAMVGLLRGGLEGPARGLLVW
jgi:phosphatidate cytidylyltransferase